LSASRQASEKSTFVFDSLKVLP